MTRLPPDMPPDRNDPRYVDDDYVRGRMIGRGRIGLLLVISTLIAVATVWALAILFGGNP